VSDLRPIDGPSALGGGWRRSFELLRLIAVTDFKRLYLGTALGYLWSVGRPLLLFGVLYVVFTQALRLGNDVPHYAVLLLTNIVVFGFFQEATGAAVGSLVAQESVLRKTQFPRIVVPLATVATALLSFGLNLVVVTVFLLASGVAPRWTWLLFPALMAVLLVFTVAVALVLSALFPRFRDIGIVWSVAATALFYATPVLYPLEAVSPHLRDVIAFNPLTPVFVLLQKWVVDPSVAGPPRLLVPALIYVVVCVLAVWVFRREAPRVAEAL
jgi:ABC-2 type transport system permease protein